MWSSNLKAAALLAVSTAGSIVAGLGQQAIVAFNSSTGTFQIAGGSISAGQILVSNNDFWGVIRAAGDLGADFGRVTGTNYSLSNGVNASAPASYLYNPVNNMNNTLVSSPSCKLSCKAIDGARHLETRQNLRPVLSNACGCNKDRG